MSVSNVLKSGVFVVAAKRTPFGAFGGSLKAFSPTDLQTLASIGALKAGNIAPEIVDSVHVGNVLSASGPDTPYISRLVSICFFSTQFHNLSRSFLSFRSADF